MGNSFPILQEKKRSYDLLIAGVLITGLAAVGVFATFGHALFSEELPQEAAVVHAPAILEPDTGLAFTPGAFDGIDITARSAIVYDVRNDVVLYARSAEEQMPLASITKVMTALAAKDVLPAETIVTLTESSVATEGNSGFEVGEQWQLGDLSAFMMMTSSNEAAQAIAQTVGNTLRTRESAMQSDALDRLAFVQRMNLKGRDLNLSHTVFANASGLDVDIASAGGYGSVRDVARLMSHLIQHHPDLVESTRNTGAQFTAENGKVYSARNTNQFVHNIPGLIASKTGFTDLAGGNLAIAYDTGFSHPIVIVVLGSTWEERFSDIETLHTATQLHLRGAER